MSGRRLDIAVAGAGPAGLAVALLLHRAGHRVVVCERFQVPRPLGSGLVLQATGLAVLDALGLGAAVRAHGSRIDRLLGRSGSGRVVLDVRYTVLGADSAGCAVHRATLFGVLFQAVTADGIALETGFDLTGIETAADGRPVLRAADGRRLGPFDLAVDAMGLRSPLATKPPKPLAYGALWASLPWPAAPFDAHRLEQRYRRAARMVGVLPLGRTWGTGEERAAFFWSLRGDDHPAWQAAGIDAWKDEVAALWPETARLLAGIAAPEELVLARYAHRTLRRPHGARLAIIGDAAHATSPQLGQGANMALIDAAALASALAEEPEVAAALARYAALRRLHVRLYQAMSLLLTPFYQSDSRVLPVLRDLVLAPAAHLPLAPRLLAALVSGQLGRPLRRIALPAAQPQGPPPAPDPETAAI